MHAKRTLYKFLGVAVLASCANIQLSHASGYQLGIHSVEGLGRAHAGEAADDSPLATIRNPAAIMHTQGSAMSNAFTYVQLNYEFDVKENPFSNVEVPFLGQHEVRMEADLKNAGTKILIPAFAYVKNQGKWGYGLSQGIHFSYELDPKEISSVGDSFGDIYIKIGHVTGNFAYAVNDKFNVGLGLSLLPGFFKADRRAGETAYIVQDLQDTVQDIPFVNDLIDAGLGGLSDPSSKIAHFKGDTIGWGWNVGATYEPTPNDRFALVYHHKSDLTFEGKYQSDLLDVPVNIPGIFSLAQGTGGQELDATVDLTTPAWIEFGAWHQINDRWELNYGSRWTGWEDSFKGIVIDAGEKGAAFAVPTIDTIRVSAGLTYALNDRLKLRAGLGRDESFQEDSKALLNTPDSPRTTYSAGLSYQLSDSSSVDFGLSYIAFQDKHISEESALFAQLSDASDLIDIPGVLGINDENNKIESDAQASIYLAGIQYNKKF